MINVALVGAWHVHFNGYANQINNNPNTKINALWDSEVERGKEKAKQFNCDFIENYDELLARCDVDAVLVCSETSLHKELISKAAKAGKHIFTEKVLCFNKADALEVAEEVKKAGVKFCISFPWKSKGDFVWIKEAIDNKLIGNVNYCRMRNAHNGASSDWLPESFYDKETCGGGAMMDLGAHSMYLLNWFLGEPISAASAFTNVMVNSVEDNAVTVLKYPNGVIGVSETAFVAENNPFEFELVGDKGTILSGGFINKTCYNIGEGWVFPNIPKGKEEPIQMWINAILNDGEIEYNIDEAVALSAIMELAYNNII